MVHVESPFIENLIAKILSSNKKAKVPYLVNWIF